MVVKALVIHPAVRAAISKGEPVVALESTIISHGKLTARLCCLFLVWHGSQARCLWSTGMPYPQNIQTAREVEAVIRSCGAVPATIAIIGGVPHVGMDRLCHR